MNLKHLAKRVTLIGESTPHVVNLSYFAGLQDDSFVTADFTIVPYEKGKPIEVADVSIPLMLGYKYQLPDGRMVYSYDHHGPDIRMQMQISSTSLSQELMRRRKNPFPHVYGTHVDTDSLLSYFVLLTANVDEQFSTASIAADHTGAENRIADVLQSLTDLRNVEFSFDCLDDVLENRTLPEKAQRLLDTRLRNRERALEYVQNGIIAPMGNGVYVGRFEEALPGELLPALIPEAKVIALVSSLKPGIKEIKVRAGCKFPSGLSLNQLGLPNYGGRWNAGSTKRFGGTPDHEVDAFIEILTNVNIFTG
ncbi:MAG: hypothetical protein Q8K75_02875 [Chlamydiales bacterium]|nr:hypothetical protein [Chlamydiales bacterium]